MFKKDASKKFRLEKWIALAYSIRIAYGCMKDLAGIYWVFLLNGYMTAADFVLK